MPIRVQVEGHGDLEFPDGTDQAVIQSTVKRVVGEQPQERTWTDTAVDALPMVGGMIGGLVSAPAGPGMLVGAALGAAGGEAWRQNLNRLRGRSAPSSMGEAAGKIAREGAESAAGAFFGAGVNKGINAARPVVSRLFRRGAVRGMKSALKPDRGYLEKMAGAKRGGIVKMENELAETALDENINVMRNKGVSALQSKIDATDVQRTGRINAAPDEEITRSGRNALRAGRRTQRKVARGDAAQDDIAAAERFLGELQTSPQTSRVTRQGVEFVDETSPVLDSAGKSIGRLRAVPGKEVRELANLTPKQQADVIQANNDRLRGLFNDQSKNVEIQSRLAVQRARTADLDRVAGTKELSQRMRKLIDLRNVGNIAKRRSDSVNPVSLTDIISLSAGRPAVFLGSVGMKAPNLASLSLLMNRAGKSVAKESEAVDALRRMLIQMGINPGGSDE